jgi:hypothetical protein
LFFLYDVALWRITAILQSRSHSCCVVALRNEASGYVVPFGFI